MRGREGDEDKGGRRSGEGKEGIGGRGEVGLCGEVGKGEGEMD